MWIVCLDNSHEIVFLADDSHKMPSLFFLWKIMKKIFYMSATILHRTLRVNLNYLNPNKKKKKKV